MIGMIWAEDRGGVMGDGERMLWHVPADFRHFRAVTIGHPIIMGRKSYDAMGGGLPGRRNIVISRETDLELPDAEVYGSFDSALGAATQTQDVWVIGGRQIFDLAMPIADELVVTELDFTANTGNIAADKLVYAPEIDPAVWILDSARSDYGWRQRSGDGRWRVRRYRRG